MTTQTELPAQQIPVQQIPVQSVDTQNEAKLWGSVAAGVIIGLLVGGSLALMFAPKAGDKLRADLGDALDDLKDRAEKAVDEVQANVATARVRSRVALEQTRENLVRSVEAGREAYVQKRDELTKQLDA